MIKVIFADGTAETFKSVAAYETWRNEGVRKGGIGPYTVQNIPETNLPPTYFGAALSDVILKPFRRTDYNTPYDAPQS